MKAIDKNISRHENGTLYFVSRRNGKLIRSSLGTNNLEKARSTIARLLADSIARKTTLAQPQAPIPVAVPIVVSPITKPLGIYPSKTLEEVMDEFVSTRVLKCKGTGNMYEGAAHNVQKHCKGLTGFSPTRIWSSYRESGNEKVGHAYGSSCNHLRWFLRKFVPWAITKGYLPSETAEALKEIPLIKVNPRRVRIPAMVQVKEFLQMVTSEDKEAEAFLRFLTCTGLRLSAANKLSWANIDHDVTSVI